MKKAIGPTLLLLALVCGLIICVHKSEARSALLHYFAGLSAQGGPSFSINDVTVTEGTNPTAVFTVTLNYPGTLRDFITTVDYTTSNGAATDPGDYTQSSGTVTFLPGPTPGGSVTQMISIPIANDALAEPTETFTVTLSNASPAFPILRSGTCTILDNDAPPPNSPTLSVNDVTVTEGNGGTTNAVFTVSLSAASNLGVTVDFATTDGSATVADNDYNGASGAIVFSPLVTTMTVSVVIVGDTRSEGNENFFVNLSNPSFATIADGQGVGTIVDDDAAAAYIAHLVHQRRDGAGRQFRNDERGLHRQPIHRPQFSGNSQFCNGRRLGHRRRWRLHQRIGRIDLSSGRQYPTNYFCYCCRRPQD